MGAAMLYELPFTDLAPHRPDGARQLKPSRGPGGMIDRVQLAAAESEASAATG